MSNTFVKQRNISSFVVITKKSTQSHSSIHSRRPRTKLMSHWNAARRLVRSGSLVSLKSSLVSLGGVTFCQILHIFCDFQIEFGGFRGIRGVLREWAFFLCRMNLELWWKSVWGTIFGGFGILKMFFVYNSCC